MRIITQPSEGRELRVSLSDNATEVTVCELTKGEHKRMQFASRITLTRTERYALIEALGGVVL